MKVHHIGYLVKSLPRARDAFLRLGYEDLSGTVPDEVRNITLCFLYKDGYTVELVSPAGPDSVVTGLMKHYQNTPYHICYEADFFNEELALLEAGGFTRMDDPIPAPAFHGRRVVFLINPAIGILELLEKEMSE